MPSDNLDFYATHSFNYNGHVIPLYNLPYHEIALSTNPAVSVSDVWKSGS